MGRRLWDGDSHTIGRLNPRSKVECDSESEGATQQQKLSMHLFRIRMDDFETWGFVCAG